MNNHDDSLYGQPFWTKEYEADYDTQVNLLYTMKENKPALYSVSIYRIIDNGTKRDKRLLYSSYDIHPDMFYSFPQILSVIPLELVTYNMCLCAIKSIYGKLKYIPEKYIDREIYLVAIKNDHTVLKSVPQDVLNSSGFYEDVVRLNFRCIELIPDNHDNYYELCKIAIQNCPTRNFTGINYSVFTKEQLHEIFKIVFKNDDLTKVTELEKFNKLGFNSDYLHVLYSNVTTCITQQN